MKKLNGVLLPGGGANIDNDSPYLNTIRNIIKIAKEMNDNGDYFPVFGICLGF